ncbi:MAG: PadR family transcriptional regulator [Alphaproteobacteria bacterium]|nr:PadR family transcriptional regulator [Alphaproteobacteria bacterium]
MRERNTGHVILGILAVGGDLSGYEIRQWVAQAIGFFWSESFGQIYPELQRLTKARLIKALPGEGKGREIKRYRIAAAGRAELERWLARAPRPERPRNELLLKIFFGPVAGAPGVRAFVDEAAKVQSARRQSIAAAEDLVIREDRAADTLVYSLITVLSGQFVTAAREAWARASLDLLDAHEAGGNKAVLRAYAKAKKVRGLS